MYYKVTQLAGHQRIADFVSYIRDEVRVIFKAKIFEGRKMLSRQTFIRLFLGCEVQLCIAFDTLTFFSLNCNLHKKREVFLPENVLEVRGVASLQAHGLGPPNF